MSQEHSASQFVVSCPDCEVTKDVDSPNDAVDFYRRHRSLTGHAVEWKQADLDPEDVGDGVLDDDLKSVLWHLDDQYGDGGIPIGIITAVRSKQGIPMGETFAEINDLRMGGELYEPRDDHLRPF